MKSNDRAAQTRQHKTLIAGLLSVALLAGCSQSTDEMLMSARQHLAQDNPEAAMIQLKNVLQADAANAEARFMLGKLNLEKGNTAAALKELRRAQELGYPGEVLLPLLADAEAQSGEFRKVIETYADRRIVAPEGQARLLAALGEAYLGEAQTAAALKSFERATSIDPEDLRLRLGLARALLFDGHPDDARREVGLVLQQQPRNAEALFLSGEIEQAGGNVDGAVAAFEAALDIRRGWTLARYRLATLLMSVNRFDAARKQIDTMVAQAPRHPLTAHADALHRSQQGDNEGALKALQPVLGKATGWAAVQFLAGSLFQRMDRHEEAMVALNRALDANPAHLLARQLLAISEARLGRIEQALQTIQPLRNEQIQDARILQTIGQVLLQAGRIDEAADALERAARIDPSSTEVRIQKAAISYATGDRERAFAELQAAHDMADDVRTGSALAVMLLRGGDSDRALGVAKDLARQLPDDVRAQSLLGIVHQQRGEHAAARDAFAEALRLQPDQVGALINMARSDIAEGKPGDAEARFSRYLQDHPDQPEAWLALANARKLQGASADRIGEAIAEAVRVAPGLVTAELAQVQFLFDQGQLDEASSRIQRLAAANPRHPEVIEWLARTHARAGRLQQAMSSYRDQAKLLPGSVAPLLSQADVQRQLGDLVGSEQTLRRATQLASQHADTRIALVRVLLDQNRQDDALSEARALQQAPSLVAIGLAMEGDILASQNQWVAAAEAYAKGFERNPHLRLALRGHDALVRSGQQKAAKRWADDWLAEHPADLPMRSQLARHALDAERYSEASRWYQEMLAIAPQSVPVLNNLAWVRGRMGASDALAYARRAQQLAPDNAAVIDTLGMLQLAAGDGELAIENLRRAVALAPDALQIRLHLAEAYLQLGRDEEARQALGPLKQATAGNTELSDETTRLLAALDAR